MHTYRFCDNVWTFILKNAELKLAQTGAPADTVSVETVKIVACDAKLMESAREEIQAHHQ